MTRARSKLPSIGSMRHRVAIQSKGTETFDAVGGRVTPWANVSGAADLPADVRPASSWERSQFAHDVGGVSHVVTIRNPGFAVTKAHRLLLAGTRVLEIRGVMSPDERGRFVRIQADEVLTGGGGTDGE